MVCVFNTQLTTHEENVRGSEF